MNSNQSLAAIRDGRPLSSSSQLKLILALSWPAILAQISVTVMQLIDAGMAGRLGTEASAAIGLVSSSTWLINGICSGVVFGFSVQTAQAVGAKEMEYARSLSRMGLQACLLFSMTIGFFGIVLSSSIPVWLGGDPVLLDDAAAYLRVFCLSLPFVLLNSWAVSMLQATGDTRLPGICQVVMCFLDVLFNLLFIFGLKFGVMGAALGTMMAEVCSSLFLTFWVLRCNPFLKGGLKAHWQKKAVSAALRIGLPVSIEQMISGSSYVMFTRIVSSLGTVSIAANSFAITAESLCYMPGYGIGSAASAVVGQCIGAGRDTLCHEISNKVVWISIVLMGLSGIAMYGLAALLMGILTPDPAVIALGAAMLRMEAFAEPMYGASIAATAILRGKGDTFWPAVLSFATIWCIRIPLAALFSKSMGLQGAWLAMNIELNCRGIFFLIRLHCSWKKTARQAV